MKRYLRRVYELVPDLEEVVVAALWEIGTLGLEQQPVESGGATRIVAYFDEAPGERPVLPGRAGDSRGGVRLADERWLEEADWMAAHRRYVQPVAVGRSFVVDPREPGSGAVETAGRRLLRLPARTAFGTGSHPSTRLAVELLEGLELEGRSLLDVGCGSGILGLAAALLGASPVVGIDVDPAAALLAGQYGRVNHVTAAFAAGTVGCLGEASRFDVAVVNVLPHHVEGDVEAVVARVRRGGRVVVSGLLETEEDAVALRWWAAGALAVEWRREEGWSALAAEVGAA